MDKFISLLTLLLSETKDSAIFLNRVKTILIGVLIYLVIQHGGDISDYIQRFSTASILNSMNEQKALQFPSLAAEKAAHLYIQTKAAGVFVVQYKPEAVNNYQNIIAWEGHSLLGSDDINDKPVDKSSELYKSHLDGINYTMNFSKPDKRKYNTFRNHVLSSVPYTYLYTCPYFNLNNVYSGYIGLIWDTPPFTNNEEESEFLEHMSAACSYQTRTLGRAM